MILLDGVLHSKVSTLLRIMSGPMDWCWTSGSPLSGSDWAVQMFAIFKSLG
jgi:hypothetical protein